MARPSRAAALLMPPMLAVVGFAPASAGGAVGTSAERKLGGLVNQVRSKRGLHALDLRRNLTRKAHRHSARMAAAGKIYHQSASVYPAGQTWGENVAVARGVGPAHRKLMRSAKHRKNILCDCFRRAGIGVVKRDGWYWITQMFLS